jgi:hypothetical protein
MDAVARVNPKYEFGGKTVFEGWSRMALPVQIFKCVCSFFFFFSFEILIGGSYRITHVAKPRVGENKPAEVKAEVTVSLQNFQRGPIREGASCFLSLCLVVLCVCVFVFICLV